MIVSWISYKVLYSSTWENGTEKSVFRDMQSKKESTKARKDRVRVIKDNSAGS